MYSFTGADPGFFAGGGATTAVYSGRLRRPRRRGSRVDKHQIKVHSVHRIYIFFAIVKKFVDTKNWWSRAGGGGGHDPPCMRA